MRNKQPLITLTTDFGTGPYVAQMKAVMLSALPDAVFVDITHDIAPQSIRQAETWLRGTVFAFPLGTVHVVVVDPGVGTSRRPIAVEARGHRFVGPDNGVLGVALAQPGARAVHLDRPHLFIEPISDTFHGRDIFAPVAAELAAGLALADVGTPIGDALGSTLPQPRAGRDTFIGEVLMGDRFGNLATNIEFDRLPTGVAVAVRVAGQPAHAVRTYAQGAPGQLLALRGSDGYLEIAIRAGSAEAAVGGAGVEVRCSW